MRGQPRILNWKEKLIKKKSKSQKNVKNQNQNQNKNNEDHIWKNNKSQLWIQW